MDNYTDEMKEQLAAIRTELKLDEEPKKVETKAEVVEEIKEEIVEEKKVEKNDGYMNEDQYLKKHGSLDGFKSKDKFEADGSFFRKIEAQNKKIDELLEFNRKAMEHSQKVEKAAYEKALRDLQVEKLEHVKNADVNAVIEIEKRTEVVKEQIKQFEAPIAPETKPLSSNEAAFKERNKDWLSGTSTEDMKMVALAQSALVYLQKTDPNIDEALAIKYIEDEVKAKFPSRFKNENQDKPSLVSSSTARREDSKDSMISRLTKQQKDFYKQAKQYGSKLTEEQYAKQLALTGDLRDE